MKDRDRRQFLKDSAATIAYALAAKTLQPSFGSEINIQPRIPRWRGFNFTELLAGNRRNFQERDFLWMAKWGFNFARLPCSYRTWSSIDDWMKIDESALQPLDQAIEFGKRYRIHINICLHRIPGYCVNSSSSEPDRLFDSSPSSMERALVAAAHHWEFLAKRYKHVSKTDLSFDLFNEPPFMSDQSRYVDIASRLVDTIRSVDRERLIFADGADLGQTPVPGLAHLDLVQSTRGYLPKAVSHYLATWVPENEFESSNKPTWPLIDKGGVVWDRDHLRTELILKWQNLEKIGVPIHVGEWGCFNKTSYEVCLAWMTDLLGLWKEAAWGWAMWNLRGPFGIVDSDRPGAAYEDFDGHRLDRKMLDLLLAN